MVALCVLLQFRTINNCDSSFAKSNGLAFCRLSNDQNGIYAVLRVSDMIDVPFSVDSITGP